TRPDPKEGHEFLAIPSIGDPDDSGIDDVGMQVEELFDLPRVNVLAAANHHVLDPAGDSDVSVVVHDRDVSGVHPSRIVDYFGGLLRLVPVPRHHAVPTCAQLARGIARKLFARTRIDDLDLQMWSDTPHRADPALEGIVGPGLSRYRRRLGHPVADPDAGHVHAVDHREHDLLGAVRARHDPCTQRTETEFIEVRQLE